MLTPELRNRIRTALDQRARELLRDDPFGSATCEWCDIPIEAKRPGTPKRFCSDSHRKLWKDRYARPLKGTR